MTANQENGEQFTGLILLTGVDKPGIASALFQTLAPFSISILDVEQIVISDRLILTVLIGLNPAHQKAIEVDLEECASINNVDIATLFTSRPMSKAKTQLIDVVVESDKLHPKTIAEITVLLNGLGVNIESISRVASAQITLRFTTSGAKLEDISKVLDPYIFENDSRVSVKAYG